MKSSDRRDEIIDLLLNSNCPIKGTELARKYKVTRQIIVKDIAILRASGKNIIATPDGYLYNRDINKVKARVTVKHHPENTIEEMEIVIKYGGSIEDVSINHPAYGEIKANLKVKNLSDLNEFQNNFNKMKLLSNLTDGIHIHTISADTKENIERIKEELLEKGFLI